MTSSVPGASVSLRDTPLSLRDDVLLVPVSSLDASVRESLEAEEGDVAVSRPGGRAPSTLVSRRAADLLERFSEDRTLVEAVVLHSHTTGGDPEEVLEEAHGLVREMLERGVLVAAGEDAEKGVRPLLAPGDRVDGRFEVRRPVTVMEDADVYLARHVDGHVALKVARSDGAPADTLRHEAAVLERLAGDPAPSLRWRGRVDGHPALALEWVRGAGFPQAAGRLRGLEGGRGRLARACAAVARAYADLHGRGVVHGDVHGRNVLVDRDGRVRLLDFGLARIEDDDPPPSDARGGVAFYRSPEAAAEVLDRGRLPAPDARSEQYSLAALLYEGVTGHRHLDFDLRQREMHEQIRDDPALGFRERGAPPWPEMEEVLLRGLRRDRGRRFDDLEEMAAALEEVARRTSVDPDGGSTPDRGREPDGLLASLADAGPPAPLPDTPPTVSVEYGAAGISYALLRVARAREDPALLTAAERWAERGAEALDRDDAFHDASIEITEETVGRASLYHSPPGVHAVRALLGRALDDAELWGRAARAFIASTRREPAGPDLALGRSGLLLGAALLLDAAPEAADGARERLRRRGDGLLETLWDELDGRPPAGQEPGEHPGVAHGWAGYLYATLCWTRIRGGGVPSPARGRLEELAGLAEPSGRGGVWPWWIPDRGAPDTMPGWCNGSAGHVFLWSEADRVVDGEGTRYRDLAVDAGWNAWEAPERAASLCCGLVGRAYALLRLHRDGAGDAWLRRARALGREAREAGRFEPERPWSLWKGRLALSVLEADLERPDEAACPLFEPEGWP